jgi:hypothetical protein
LAKSRLCSPQEPLTQGEHSMPAKKKKATKARKPAAKKKTAKRGKKK